MAMPLGKRILAGFWFLTAAGLMLVPLFILTGDFANNKSFFWTWLSPLLISAVVGSLLGAGILDAQKNRNGWNAALRGFLVAVISFLLYAVALSVWEIYANQGDLGPKKVFVGMLIMILYAAAFFSWIIMIIGALAGLSLYLVFASRER
jgi:hypothetical protein